MHHVGQPVVQWWDPDPHPSTLIAMSLPLSLPFSLYLCPELYVTPPSSTLYLPVASQVLQPPSGEVLHLFLAIQRQFKRNTPPYSVSLHGTIGLMPGTVTPLVCAGSRTERSQ